jgi:hypothetical protein
MAPTSSRGGLFLHSVCEDRVRDGPASGEKGSRVGISSTVFGVKGGSLRRSSRFRGSGVAVVVVRCPPQGLGRGRLRLRSELDKVDTVS